MTPARAAVRMLATAALLALSSCIDGHEECWIDARGGGRASIRYSVPESALRAFGGEPRVRELVATLVRETPAITGSRHAVETRDGRATITFDAEFASILDLVESSPLTRGTESVPRAVSQVAGEVRARFEGLAVEVNRRSQPAKAIPLAGLLPASNFRGHRLVTILHLPAPASESNADRVADGGRTLVWDTALAATLGQPRVMHFRMGLPIPWGWVAVVTAGFAMILAFAMLRWRARSTRRRAASPGLNEAVHPAP